MTIVAGHHGFGMASATVHRSIVDVVSGVFHQPFGWVAAFVRALSIRGTGLIHGRILGAVAVHFAFRMAIAANHARFPVHVCKQRSEVRMLRQVDLRSLARMATQTGFLRDGTSLAEVVAISTTRIICLRVHWGSVRQRGSVTVHAG